MYIPKPPLSDFVHSFWLYDSKQSFGARERALPSGTVELVINLHDEPLRISNRDNQIEFTSFRHSLISGPQSRFFEGEMPAPVSLVGVHFKPGGAYPFLGLPLNELTNSFETLDVLWGSAGADLRDRLLAADSAAGKFRILESFLRMKLRASPPLSSAVAFAVKEIQSAAKPRPISAITEQIGISPRHFIHIFSREVGMAPKLFCRIQRFQRVLRLVETVNQVEWGDLCLACEYYDQAHLIHDFRAFSGCTPTEYLKRKTGRLNHVAI